MISTPGRKNSWAFLGALLFILSIYSSMSVNVHAEPTQNWRQVLPQAKLLGSGEFRWWGFSIYTAKMWQQAPNKEGGLDPKASFALELTYHKSISRARFVDSSIDEIRRIHGKQFDEDKLSLWRQYMEKAFTDVSSGDQLIGVFIPGKGCQFYSQHRLLAEISDEIFASVFFSIWLDPRTKDQQLRQQLLGNSKLSWHQSGTDLPYLLSNCAARAASLT